MRFGPARVHCRRILPFLLLTPGLLLAQSGVLQRTDEPINVLVLYFGSPDQPGFAQLLDEFRAGLEREQSAPTQIFVETFDQYQAANDVSFERTMEQFLAQKYKDRKLDLVVPVGDRPLAFLSPRRERLFPGAKLLYAVFRQPAPDATGVIVQVNYLPTIEIALKQNPGMKRLLLITGSSPAERAGMGQLEEVLKKRFRSEGRAIEVEVLAPGTYADARAYLARLPADTVCVFDSYFMDSAGQMFTPARVLRVFSQVSTRPIYSEWEMDVGRGGVGGRVMSVTEIGRTMAQMASRVLRGEDPAKIPPARGDFQRYMFDWQQMKRWGIKLDQLPPGSTVINREYTAWELYKWQILGGVLLILVETALIVLLFRLRTVRRRAALELAFRLRLESIMAELSAAFLNLTAEVINAEVDSALQRLLDVFQLDRISVFEFSPDSQRWHLVFAKRAAGIAAPPEEVDTRELAWLVPRLLQGERVVASRLEDLPPDAVELQQFAAKLKIRSVAIFPLHCDGVTFGKLTCSAVQREITWTPEALAYLQAVADIFGSALKRLRAQEALARSEQLKASILSSLSSQIAVVDRNGRIIASNDQWQAFTKEHGGRPDRVKEGSDHFELCRGCEDVSQPAGAVLEGMRLVWEGKRDYFEMEYECPLQSDERRWFLMTVTPLRSPSGGGVIAHHDISESKRSEQAIRDLSGKLITAQEEERSRIARELHDDINQQLALLAIDLQRLESSLPDGAAPARSGLQELWKRTNDIAADIQRISHQLHSSRLEHLGLVSALRGLCQEFSKQQQIEIDFRCRDVSPTLDSEIALSLFRIAQESLRNVAKHSQAKNVRVELMGEHDDLMLCVSDDGIGFDPERSKTWKGLGMISMQERLRLVGGKLSVSSQKSLGTQVEVRVPLPARREGAGRSLASSQASRS